MRAWAPPPTATASGWAGTPARRQTAPWNRRSATAACIRPGTTATCAAARAIHSSLFVAHIRAATDTPAQETNCHPFRHGNWLFVHNGLIRDFPLLRRDLMLMIAPAYFGSLEGSTDSELMFLLALSFGLEDDPLPALARMVGAVEDRAPPWRGAAINMTVCALDGERMIAVRYSSERESRTLFPTPACSTCASCIPTIRRSRRWATTPSCCCPNR